MAAVDENLEEKLTSSLSQLQAEAAIFERMIYKNKNQHRRCSYFQYLLKVRRDLKRLQSAKLEEVLNSCFQVINGKKPKQKVHLLESLKRRKCEGGKYTFLERLVGVARLLSEMVEPMMKAAIEISTLLARSFFMGFSLTILALLARLRVLVQQMLLDIVSIHNIVSSLSQKKQAVKITQGGLEVYREYYPTNEEFVVLECEWRADKFVLHERNQTFEVGRDNSPLGEIGSSSTPAVVHYQIMESLLGDEEAVSKDEKIDQIKGDEDDIHGRTRDKNDDRESGLFEDPSLARATTVAEPSKKVAFISVRKPQSQIPTSAESKINGGDKEDSFFNLLTGGIVKDNLF